MLYFSLEDTLGRLQERLYQLVDAEEDPERLILQTESHGIGQGLEEQIVSFIHTYPDISLIVIDTLQKVRKSDQNGSMYANDYKDIGALKELADKYGICILLVHHLRKQSSSDPYDQISGSTGIMGVADTTWLMHRQRMSKTATIRVIGRDMDEKMLHIHEENCVWTLDEEETAEQQALKAIPDYLWKVADYIDSVGKWQGTATELLVAANISDVKPNQFTRKMAHYARDTKATTVEVLFPSPDTVFQKVDGTASFEVFDPKIADDDMDDTADEDRIDTEDAPEQLRMDGADSSESMSAKEAYLAQYSSRIKRQNQLLLYSSSKNPLTVVGNINKKSREFMEETGVNVAFMAFGFIHWKESDSSNCYYRAPTIYLWVAPRHPVVLLSNLLPKL